MTQFLDRTAVERWINAALASNGLPTSLRSVDVAKERPWATVLRVDLGDETVWFKACRPVQAFEPGLTAALASRWPDRLPEVLAHDIDRRWLLMADAGARVGDLGNPPETWLRALPLYAELQLGEEARIGELLDLGVPAMGVATLPDLYEDLLTLDLPLAKASQDRLRHFAPTFVSLCEELVAASPLTSIQHDDLHVNSLFVKGDELRFLDWGDASVGHPFFSLVVTFWFLEMTNGLHPSDRWFPRLRDAYLEGWRGRATRDLFAIAFRVGAVAHPLAWLRHRAVMRPRDRRAFDRHLVELLRWVIERAVD